jgi:hypothetical protein
MKKVLLFASILAVISIYACQKESLSSTANASELGYATDRDSTGGHGHHQGPGGPGCPGGPLGDSLHHHQHPFDSLGHHGLDSLMHHHLDSLHHHVIDTTFTPGGPHHGGPNHGPHPGGDTLNPGGGVHIQPVTIQVTDLPQAAQDWLTANKPGAVIANVLKITKPDGTVVYVVKIKNGGVVRFDASGNKIG